MLKNVNGNASLSRFLLAHAKTLAVLCIFYLAVSVLIGQGRFLSATMPPLIQGSQNVDGMGSRSSDTHALYSRSATQISTGAMENESNALAFAPKGVHESSSCDTTIGWACDQDDYSQALEIQIYKDGPIGTGVLLSTITADKIRGAAVANQCGGKVNHGFVFNTPDSLKDGKPHALYIYAVNIGPQGANPLLTMSPKTINCQPAVTVNLASPRYPGVPPGNGIPITYNWAGTRTNKPYKVLIQFLDTAGALLFQDDHMPPTPTNQWAGPVSYTRNTTVPPGAFGSYRIMAALYDPISGERLILKPGPGVATGLFRYHVGTLTVGAPVGFELVGRVEVVRPSSERCEPDDIPDMTPRAFRAADGKVNLISSHYVTRRMIGDSLNTVRLDCGVIFNSTNDPVYDNFRYHEWMSSTYTLDGNTVYALIHNEWYAHLLDPACRPYHPIDQWVNAITMVVSTDKGATYSHPTDYIVIRPPVQWNPSDPRFTCGPNTVIRYGAFVPSNIIKNVQDNYYYALYGSERDPLGLLPDGQTCLMRTSRLDRAAAWEILTAGGWDTNPRAIPLALANISKMRESLTYNTYLKQYIALGQHWNPVKGVYYSLSSDLISWSKPVMITPAPADDSSFIYNALLDPNDDSTRNFEKTGQIPYMYYVRKVNGENMNRELVRQRIKFIIPTTAAIETPAR